MGAGAAGVASVAAPLGALAKTYVDTGTPRTRPCILFVMTDDMPEHMLEDMPVVMERVVRAGTRFTRFNTAIPLCGPNRSAILTGLFPHNNGVKTNSADPEFRAAGNPAHTYVKLMHDAGYATGMFGKYMNARAATATDVPPGYDQWYELLGSHNVGEPFPVSENGRLVTYPGNVRASMLVGERCRDFVASRAGMSQPFLAIWTPTNPHNPYDPTPANAHDFDGVPFRNVPSVNEDTSDKPRYRGLNPVSNSEMQRITEGMKEELADVDDMLAQILDAFDKVTRGRNAVVVFTSDNGFQIGEHRLQNKSWPFQESIQIPCAIRATHHPSGRVVDALTSSVDLYATFLAMAGANPSRVIDGRNLFPLLSQPVPASWRKRVLIEDPVDRQWQMYREYVRDAAGPGQHRNFAFIDNLDGSGDEFYNLVTDPYQLTSTPANITTAMRDRLQRLTTLSGEALWAEESAA